MGFEISKQMERLFSNSILVTFCPGLLSHQPGELDQTSIEIYLDAYYHNVFMHFGDMHSRV